MSIATEQAPGVYRRRVGEILVTALVDGSILIPTEYLQNVTPEEYDLVLRAGGRRPPYHSAINAFLLQWDGRTVLVDAGTSTLMGPGAGKLPKNLAAAGVAPEDVTAILLTHLHADHAGGLLDAAGAPQYPNAELHVAETEYAHWHDDVALAKAPERAKPAFATARRTTAPYAARTNRFQYCPVMPGIEAVALPGHTPGHTGYLITSGGETLFIWGDVCHVPVLQAAKPEVTLVFDTDPAQAAATRRRAFEMALERDLLVTGMHMSFPGFCRITRTADAYAVHPEAWSELD